MKLKEYLVENGIVHGFFAKKLGVASSKLSIWISGQNRPRLETILIIEQLTKGKVKPEDWI